MAVSEEKSIGARSVPEGGVDIQQPLSLLESAQTLAGIKFHAARKLGKNFTADNRHPKDPSVLRMLRR